MTLWHKWEFSYYHYLDWDIFLDDLSSGRTDFCSELLVNAILASASVSLVTQSRIRHFRVQGAEDPVALLISHSSIHHSSGIDPNRSVTA